jgi:two-component system response regulator AtoC
VVLCRGDAIEPQLLPLNAHPAPATTEPVEATDFDNLLLSDHVEALEKRLIKTALEHSGDNKSAAARLLGVSERTLWYKLKKYGF